MSLDNTIQHAVAVFNLLEGLLWLGIAAGLTWRLCRDRSNADLKAVAALLFLTFGLSDFVEIQTGGWYKPRWLLAWKASNLVGFVIVYAMYRRRSR
jgi:hypothetical protein